MLNNIKDELCIYCHHHVVQSLHMYIINTALKRQSIQLYNVQMLFHIIIAKIYFIMLCNFNDFIIYNVNNYC